jgi:hypothetical protein
VAFSEEASNLLNRSCTCSVSDKRSLKEELISLSFLLAKESETCKTGIFTSSQISSSFSPANAKKHDYRTKKSTANVSLCMQMMQWYPFPIITCSIPEDITFNPDIFEAWRIHVLSQNFGEIHLDMEPSKHANQIFAAVFVPL